MVLDAAAPTLAVPRSIQGWQPLTFHDRGVVVPFTTPALTGARLRAAERGGFELVLPEVAGPGSVGILPWERVGTQCSPTLFDRRLGARLTALTRLTPAAVRQAVCAEAAEGLAGPEAQEAALAARDAAATESEQAQTHLLAQWRAGAEGAAPPAAVVSAFADLAALLGPVGLGAAAAGARLGRALALVAALPDQMPERLRACQGAGATEVAAIVGAAGQVSAAATAALTAARALAKDAAALLRRWTAAPGEVAAAIGRAEWLLDGWPWLCRLAASADERINRTTVLAELAALMPPLPREAAASLPAPPPRPELAPSVRDLLRGADWRSGVTPQDLIARNERLLAGALLPAG